MRPLLPVTLFALAALAGHWSAPWLAPPAFRSILLVTGPLTLKPPRSGDREKAGKKPPNPCGEGETG
jgi:hypothetical protein